jgi:dienelactone hydrolase
MCHPEVPAGHPTPVVAREEVLIPLDGEMMPASLARPEAGEGPVVLLISDIYGRSPFYQNLAARLATAGMVALLPDFFFREGSLPEPPTRDAALARKARLDENRALQNLSAAIDWLQRQPGVRGGRVGTIGFCLGGTFVLDLAAARDDLATVCFYGFPAPDAHPAPNHAPAPLEVVDRMNGPILAFWGDQDAGVGIPNVDKLTEALKQRGVDYECTIYPGLGHGFMAQSQLDPAHPAYQMACDAWTRTIGFYRERLGAPAIA